MVKNFGKGLIWAGALLLLAGCAAGQGKQVIPDFSAVNLNPSLKSGEYQLQTENFLIILDASQSMSSFRGDDDFRMAKEVVSRLNRTLPDVRLKGGLRSFGHSMSVSREPTTIFAPFGDYNPASIEKGLAQIREPGGNSRLDSALLAAIDDLKGASGRTAVIVVSDGLGMGAAPERAAEELKKTYGERLCLYPVLIGDGAEGKRLMENLARIGGCGFSVQAEQIASGPGMAEYVSRIFLAKAPPKPAPVAPPRPAPAPVVMDSDGDGVPDHLDKCPGTPKGAPVNQVGCWIIENIRFDFDKAEIKPEYFRDLDKVIEVLKQNPDLNTVIEGHTDGIGAEAYNQRLSERRANSVREYLVEKGIPAQRLTAQGFGLTQPIAPNDTEEGRAMNRRVQLSPVK
jgi:OOP family OmpA-OmpF porin